MARSARLRALDTRVAALRKQFLPARFSATGSYTPEELDNARAFRMLTHAEIEHYFEDRALEIANAAFDLWRTKSKVSLPIACLLSNGMEEKVKLPKTTGTSVTPLSIAGKVVSAYRKAVGDNHGVRTPNLLTILLPIGFPESEIDAVWLATTDGFGAKRGATAHSTAISYNIDPQDDYNTVRQIMDGIRDIDGHLNRLRARLR